MFDGPVDRSGKRYPTRRRRVLGALVAAVVLGAGLATWALIGPVHRAPPASAGRAGTVEVALSVSCKACVPCRPGGNCPACDHKLGAAAAAVPGVVTASFVEHRSSGVGHVAYRSRQTSLALIEATVERAPPYPGCCSGLHATGEHGPR